MASQVVTGILMSKSVARVSVIVLAYNSVQHLPKLFDSLASQTHSDVEVIVVDNASSDTTLQWLEQQTIIPITIIANSRNLWFSAGNNRAIPSCTGEYILFCNDDIQLDQNCISQLLRVFQDNPAVGMAGAKLLKMPVKESNESSIIDSAGLQLLRNRRCINRGENVSDQGQFDELEPVFGITGAVMMVSATAISQVSYNGNLFDDDFIAYKEDIDLSWRMWRHGFEVWYQPTAIGYHARSVQSGSLRERKSSSATIKQYSYRNHIWALLKNETGRSFLKHAIYILPYEFVKLLYILVREPTTLAALPQILFGIRLIVGKRASAVTQLSDPTTPWIQ